jgi:hypothetical protein
MARPVSSLLRVFCWHDFFASKTAPAKIKIRQQNFRHASKSINPNDFDMPHKKMRKNNLVSPNLVGNVLIILL